VAPHAGLLDVREFVAPSNGGREEILEPGSGRVLDRFSAHDVIDRNARRLLRLVGDLLFIAQVDAGKLSLDRTEVDLAAIPRESVEATRPCAGAAGVDLRADVEEVPPIVGDRGRIGQALDNLVSNASRCRGSTATRRRAACAPRCLTSASCCSPRASPRPIASADARRAPTTSSTSRSRRRRWARACAGCCPD
jgi:hypothetical protein